LTLDAVRRDVDALCAIERGSATAGEREAASLLRDRFAAAGAAEATVEPFRYSLRWTDAHAAHHVAALAAALRGGVGGALLALGAGVSYALDFSGRSQWSRRLFPRGEGANAVARLRPLGERRGTLILVAHLDAARTGLVWDPRFTAGWEMRAAKTGKAPSPAGLPLAGAALTALGSLSGRRAPRVAGGAIAALGLGLAVECASNGIVPGANDNACAAAGLAELVRGFAESPLEHTEVIAVASGCEEVGMGGFAVWLRRHRDELDPTSTVVLGLDQIGAGEPTLLTGEGLPGLVKFSSTANAFVDVGADALGVERPQRFHGAIGTDPACAAFAGLEAASLVGVKDGGYPNYHQMTDTPDRVDWSTVSRCLALTDAAARAFDGSLTV
jgi:hypothetical protein